MKRANILLFCMIFTVVFVAFELYRVVNAPAYYSVESPSLKYRVENVWVFTVLLPSNDVSFMRFVEKETGKVYRSPLFSQSALEMGLYEDNQEVGMVSMRFSKRDQSIDLWINDWCSSWLNFFVSNTYYRVKGDGECRLL